MQTNFFSFGIPSESFQAQTIPFEAEKLRELRAEHNASYSFFRNGDSIIISPHSDDSPELGEPKTFDPAEHPKLVGSLLRHLLFQEFRKKLADVIPTSFSPLEFQSRHNKHDPIFSLVPEDMRETIGYPRVMSIAVETISQGGKPKHGLLVSYRNRWRLNATLADLHEDEFPIIGCEVLAIERLEGMDGVLAPKENLIGVVQSIEGDEARIETNNGTILHSMSDLTIRRSPRQLSMFLRQHIGDAKTEQVFNAIRKNSERNANPNQMIREIREIGKWISSLRFKNGDNFSAYTSSDCQLRGPSYKLERTKLIFDYTPGTANDRPLSGLWRNGPFDSSKFDPKSPHVLLMFRGKNRGAMTEFFGRLVDGIPESDYFKKGLRDLFRLHEVKHSLALIEGDSPKHYEQAFDEAVSKNNERNFDIVLVECSDDSEKMPPNENPYLKTKVRAMGLGIPVQCVRDSHVRATEEHANTLGPLALQMYAKIGGQPWRLPASQSVDQELIIGLGSSLRRQNAWQGAEQSRVVGLTTFFLGDGRYVLGENLPAVPYEEYFESLLAYLEKAINELSDDYGWEDGQSVRVVFHVFKPLKNLEVEVVDELMKRFKRFNIVYAFVTVSLQHRWLMYQNLERQGRNTLIVPSERTENLILDDRACLVQLKGNKDRTNFRHKPPQPVKIRVHEKSTYDDLQYISQQVMDFSCLFWRGFFPSELPVTIQYSKLMADLTSKLQQIDGWNPAVINQHFRRKKWFL